MGNFLRSLIENRGNVASDQVVAASQQFGVDNTNLNRIFEAFNSPEDSSEAVVERPNVIVIQPTKNGGIDAAIQTQYDRMKNDLYGNVVWDILLCENIEDAAKQLSTRGRVTNLVYLHHGSDWGLTPVTALRGDDAKTLLDLRENFLIERIKKDPNNKNLSTEKAKEILNLDSLRDIAYEKEFKSAILDSEAYKTGDKKVLAKVFFGLESLFKKLGLNGTFIDASCFQGSDYNAENNSFTILDTLKRISFGKINILVNTNATNVGISITYDFGYPQSINKTSFKDLDIGTVMNSEMSFDSFRNEKGWINYKSDTQSDIETSMDLVLNSYKEKPCFELVKRRTIDKTMRGQRFLYFSKKFRKWHESEIKKYLLKSSPTPPSPEVLKGWLDRQLTNVKNGAKI
jgi:hypothetical protein